MRCKTVKKNLTAYLDGEIPERLQERISEHIARCTTCQKESEAFKRIRAAVESMEKLPLQPSVTANQILEKARAESLPLRKREPHVEYKPLLPPFHRLWRPALAVASLFAAVGLYWLYPSLRALRVPTQQDVVIAERMELFENMDLIRDLSLLELLESGEHQDGKTG